LAKSNSELIIGKNTVIRKAIQYKIDQLSEDNPFYEDLKSIAKANPALENLKKQMTGKVGLIFSSKPAYDLKPLIENNKLETAAKVGSTAPNNVVIPAGPTNLDPS
jgi:large subunit ribosomal protein LP0